MINAAWLLRGLKRLGSYVPEAGWGVLALRVATACVVMGTLQVVARGLGGLDWPRCSPQWQRAFTMAGCLGASAVVHFATLPTGMNLRALGAPSDAVAVLLTAGLFCQPRARGCALPLLEAAVSVAQDEVPDLDVQGVLAEVDRLANARRARLPREATPPQPWRH